MAVQWLGPFKHRQQRDLRQEMIDHTNEFLNWALAEDRGLPRIPTCRVDRGGFGPALQRPEARRMVLHWWARVFSQRWPVDRNEP